MKRILAVFCVAALSLMTCVAPFASSPGGPANLPSGGGSQGSSSSNAGTTNNNTTNNNTTTNTPAPAVTGTEATIDAAGTTVAIPAGEIVMIIEALQADFQNDPVMGEIVKKLSDLASDGQQHTTAEIFEILGVTTATAQTTPSNTVININALEAITKLLDFKFSKAGTRLPNGKIKATFPGNALTQGKKAEQLVVVQIDPVEKDANGNPVVHYVDVEISADNKLTVEFPCSGPFYIMQRTDVQ